MKYFIAIAIIVSVCAVLFFWVRRSGKDAKENEILKGNLDAKKKQDQADQRPSLSMRDLLDRMRKGKL